MTTFFRKNLLALSFSVIALGAMSLPSAQAEGTNQIKPGDDRAPIQGKVIEKIDAASYSYLRLKTQKNEEVWVAVPQTDIKINTQASLLKPIPMFGFESKTLKRRFDRIYFGVLTDQAEALSESSRGHWIPGTPLSKKEHGTKDSALAHSTNHPGHPGMDGNSSLDLTQIKIKKAEGENAVTISELFSKKSDLNAKTVQIRGKVIKYNSGILGKNWIHIADGTGTLEGKNFDITVITENQAKLGDTVLVSGKVTLEKKLDPYFFPIAIENAKVKTN